jgi:hypothetical protein
MANPTVSLMLLPALALTAGLATSNLGSPTPARAAAAAPATCTDAPAPRAAVDGCTDAPPAPPPPQLRSKLFHQLRYHTRFPASRAELLATFRATAELSQPEIAWIRDHLPPGRLATPASTLAGLFPDAPAHLLARLDTGLPTLAQR